MRQWIWIVLCACGSSAVPHTGPSTPLPGAAPASVAFAPKSFRILAADGSSVHELLAGDAVQL
jgi:hypothetical protein